MKGIDYAWNPPKPSSIKSAGFDFVMRYLAPLPNTKVITYDEKVALHAARLGIGLVWEREANRALSGHDGGIIDGPEARRQATALGFPSTLPIYGAVDFQTCSSQFSTVQAYLNAAQFGCYGNGYLCQYLNPGHSWLMDWDGLPSENMHLQLWPTAHLHQHGGQVIIDGITCDVNDCFNPDCLWFSDQRTNVQPQFSPPIAIVSWCIFQHSSLGLSIAGVGKDGAVFCDPPKAYLGGANGQSYFANREAAEIVSKYGGYKIIDTANEEYNYP